MTRAVVVSTAGGAATLTLPALSGNGYEVKSIAFSYSQMLTNVSGNLTVTSAGTTVVNMDILTGDWGLFDQAIVTDAINQAVVITLGGASTAVGKISVEYVTY